ncbi:Nn.00g041690.m01.CDS01 [Neocucurbitaria sp. VM-36]
MLLHPDPSLAEVPGFSTEQLDALARSVELRRQQLENDIKDYIKRKQDELRKYEQELVEHHRSMECRAGSGSAEKIPTSDAENITTSPAIAEQPAQSSPDAREQEPGEKTKRTKHTRVHKRERELYGLVTPVFLPLLDARETSPTAKEKKHSKGAKIQDANTTTGVEQTTLARDAEKGKESRNSRREMKDMEGAEPGQTTPHAEIVKKPKRSPLKKSSLRGSNTPKSRRKRVSLVIDGQTVLPADTVIEPPLTSPSSEATSASNSTTSLDEMIDPRLTRLDVPVHLEHHDAEHHSLPSPTSNTVYSPTKPLTNARTPLTTIPQVSHSPPLPSPSIPVGPPQNATRTFLDPSPQHPASIPETAGPNPIYPSDYTSPSSFVDDELAEEQHWDTYVGGLHGSGVDDVDQAGSYGYPSSLGASYLESYMQQRPLSVRMQAADKAGLEGREKREMVLGEKEQEKRERIEEEEFGVDIEDRRDKDADDGMDIVGSMEGF